MCRPHGGLGRGPLAPSAKILRPILRGAKDGGAVEGDIFHRSLSIDENSQFEGSSRRVENPMEPSGIAAKDPEKKEIQKPAPAPSPSIDGDLQRVERWFAQSCSQMTS